MDIKQLQQKIDQFANDRDWKQFHTPKNLSMALSVESSELLEIFQWLTPEESQKISKNATLKEAVADEMSDIMVYLLRMADLLEIDVEASIDSKMKKNAQKYPVDKCKGKSNKYSEY